MLSLVCEVDGSSVTIGSVVDSATMPVVLVEIVVVFGLIVGKKGLKSGI